MALLTFQFYRSQFSKALEHTLRIKGDPKILWKGLAQSNSTLPIERQSATERGKKLNLQYFDTTGWKTWIKKNIYISLRRREKA